MNKRGRRFRLLPCLSLSALLTMVLWGFAGQAQFKENFNKEYPLSAGGRFRLNNVNGNVVIKAWDAPKVSLNAVKEAPSAELMSELKIGVEASDGSLSVDTRYPKGRGGKFSVYYEISLPKSALLEKVETVNGRVDIEGMTSEVHFSTVNGAGRVRGCSGRVDAETVNGDLFVETVPGQALREAKLNTVNGGITLVVPDLSDVTVSAETVNGVIETDYSFEIKKHLVGKTMSGTIGAGAGKIEMETVNGQIRLMKKS